MYGVTDYYESGLGIDFSLIGFTAILNNKIGFTDIKNPDKQKGIGFSYYNKSSFMRGGTSFPTSYDPFKMAHFETGNYFIMGWFIKDYEIILSPHIDLNYLMSRSQEHYYLNNGRIIQECHTNVGGNAIPSEITNSNLFFLNYGFNVALKTKSNLFFEMGVQYLHADIDFYHPERTGLIQFSLGVGYAINMKNN